MMPHLRRLPERVDRMLELAGRGELRVRSVVDEDSRRILRTLVDRGAPRLRRGRRCRSCRHVLVSRPTRAGRSPRGSACSRCSATADCSPAPCCSSGSPPPSPGTAPRDPGRLPRNRSTSLSGDRPRRNHPSGPVDDTLPWRALLPPSRRRRPPGRLGTSLAVDPRLFVGGRRQNQRRRPRRPRPRVRRSATPPGSSLLAVVQIARGSSARRPRRPRWAWSGGGAARPRGRLGVAITAPSWLLLDVVLLDLPGDAGCRRPRGRAGAARLPSLGVPRAPRGRRGRQTVARAVRGAAPPTSRSPRSSWPWPWPAWRRGRSWLLVRRRRGSTTGSGRPRRPRRARTAGPHRRRVATTLGGGGNRTSTTFEHCRVPPAAAPAVPGRDRPTEPALFLKVYGQDSRDADLLYRAYRTMILRDADG